MYSKCFVFLMCINIEEVVYNIFFIDINSFVLKNLFILKNGREVK